MEIFERRRKRRDPWKLISRSIVSFICVCLAQFALYLISSFFVSASIMALFFLSVMVLLVMAGIGRRCKRLFGLRASAPAFVFTNLIFIWCVYVIVVREAVSAILDIVFHAELIMLQIGLYRILSNDPGFVDCGPRHEKLGPLSDIGTYVEGSEPPTHIMDQGVPSDESSLLLGRVRYCKHCHAHVKGFDHHCPAFGNCIGQNNHVLFIVLLAGFIIAEACYIMGASQIVTRSRILDTSGRKKIGWTETLATSTMIFSLLQVLWQVVFLTWHIFCVCFNIRTDEWINWKKYPEFQHTIQPQPGEAVTRFKNPYDKGILQNLKEFVETNG